MERGIVFRNHPQAQHSSPSSQMGGIHNFINHDFKSTWDIYPFTTDQFLLDQALKFQPTRCDHHHVVFCYLIYLEPWDSPKNRQHSAPISPAENMPRQDTDFTMKEWPGRGLRACRFWTHGRLGTWPSNVSNSSEMLDKQRKGPLTSVAKYVLFGSSKRNGQGQG